MLKGDRVAAGWDTKSDEKGSDTEGDVGRPLEGDVWVRGPSVLERVDAGRTIVDG